MESRDFRGFSDKNQPPTLPTLEEKQKATEELNQAIMNVPNLNTEDLEKRFKFHPAATQGAKDKHEAVRNWCLELAIYLSKTVPKGREQSLAITHLEEVMFWSNAGIARNP